MAKEYHLTMASESDSNFAPHSADLAYSRANQKLLLAGFTVSTAGDWLYRLALPILVLQLTGSAVSTALTFAIEYIPYLVLSMFAGVVADRFDRRRTLAFADASSALIMLVLTVLVAGLGIRNLAVIFLGAFALAAVRPVHHPALQGLIPEIVGRASLARVNAQIQSVDSVLMFVGPVIGAGLVAVLSPYAALWINTVSFVFSALAIWLIRTPSVRRTAGRIDLLAGVREGLRYLGRDRVTLWGAALMAGTNVGLYLIQANLIYILTEDLGYSTLVVGVVFGANGLGAVVGAMLAPSIGRRFPPGMIIVAAMGIAAIATTPLALPFGLYGFVAGWAMVGVATTTIIVTWFTLRQQIVPSEVLGRVVATSRMMAYATIPVASVAGGAMLAIPTIGPAAVVLTSIAVQAVVALLAWFSPLRGAIVPPPTPEPSPVQASQGQAADA